MFHPFKDIAANKITINHGKSLGYTAVYSGSGWVYFMEIDKYFQFPRNKKGTCAFCAADPCDDRYTEGIETNIHYYYQNSPEAYTCPVCEGKAT